MNKTVIKILPLLVAMSCFCGCAEDMPYPTPYTEPIDGLQMFTGTIESLDTKVSLNESGVPVWEVGDSVGVFAGSVSNVRFNLKENLNTSAIFQAADDIGITQTIDMVHAYYPYKENTSLKDGKLSVNVPQNQKYRKGSCASESCLMLATASTRSLQFKHLCGFVQFRLANTEFGKVKTIKMTSSDSQLLSGSAEVDVNYDKDGPVLKILDTGNNSILLDCGDGVDINTSGEYFYFTVPEGVYKQLVFEIINEEGEVFESRTKTSIAVERGTVTDAGLAQVYIEESFYGKANCIQKDEPGTYTFDAAPYFTTDSYGYAYEFNERDDFKPAASADLVWQSVPDMITAVSLSSDKKTVTFTAAKTGNALIALYNEEGDIIWSFHLWISPVNEVQYPNGYVVFDRNLGATSNTRGDMSSWGLYYQWGRKDPFPEVASTSSTNLVMKTYYDKNNQTFSFTGEPSAAGVDHYYSISRPTVFLQRVAAGNTVDWIWDGGSNNLWGNPEGYKNPDINTLHKSIYDPCPEGYMVSPTKLYTGNGVVANSSQNAPFDNTNSGRTLVFQGLNEWYPAARQIHHNWPKATMKSNDITGRYWLSSPASGNKWKALSVTWGAPENVIYPEWPQWRGFGYSVRCVKVVTED